MFEKIGAKRLLIGTLVLLLAIVYSVFEKDVSAINSVCIVIVIIGLEAMRKYDILPESASVESNDRIYQEIRKKIITKLTLQILIILLYIFIVSISDMLFAYSQHHKMQENVSINMILSFIFFPNMWSEFVFYKYGKKQADKTILFMTICLFVGFIILLCSDIDIKTIQFSIGIIIVTMISMVISNWLLFSCIKSRICKNGL